MGGGVNNKYYYQFLLPITHCQCELVVWYMMIKFAMPITPSNPDYTREDLSFVEKPPKDISIECPICLQIMTKDISLTSCGHHFCTSCIERVYGSCPKCRATPYQIFPDTDRQHYIRGLQVYCSNRKYGCTWKGELTNLSGHINKGKRVGDCQFEVVECRYYYGLSIFRGHCSVKRKRADLANHEGNECPSRPYTCQYCGHGNSYWVITLCHYDKCPRYPVTCPNKCDPMKTMFREEVDAHRKNDCPREPVACELHWAGCTARPQRKNIEKHVATNIVRHFTLLAKACKELKEENSKLKEIISRNGLK